MIFSGAGRQYRSTPFSRMELQLSIHLEDVDVVRKRVEEGAGEAFLAESRGPLVEWQVRAD